jgi:hypothetical protein
MKKLVFMALVLLLALSVFTVSALAEGKDDGIAIGYISFLNLSEEQIRARREGEGPAREYLKEHGVLESAGHVIPLTHMVPYDTLDAMLMGLLSGEVDVIEIPDCTAKYLCAVNDRVKQAAFFHPEKADEFSQDLIDRLGSGYSFLLLEENSGLRDQFDQAIEAMKADGTLEELVRVHITDAARSGKPEAVEFETFDGEPIRVAVTGSLPPMDYVAEDGSFAGFNTAILAEVGKRLEKNIELVQTDSVGRALALAQGKADVVFWTRGASETQVMSKEEFEAFRQEKRAKSTEEEAAIMERMHEAELPGEHRLRDMPEGTITTAPYYSDMNVLVILK